MNDRAGCLISDLRHCEQQDEPCKERSNDLSGFHGRRLAATTGIPTRRITQARTVF